MNDVARFCLGRYWNRATPDQQREYTELFHRVLMNNVVGHMGDYKQTRINVILGRPELRDGLVNVPTTIEREGNPPGACDLDREGGREFVPDHRRGRGRHEHAADRAERLQFVPELAWRRRERADPGASLTGGELTPARSRTACPASRA